MANSLQLRRFADFVVFFWIDKDNRSEFSRTDVDNRPNMQRIAIEARAPCTHNKCPRENVIVVWDLEALACETQNHRSGSQNSVNHEIQLFL